VATLDDARALAAELRRRSPIVRGVDLFGSTARNGTGHDVDFAILVNDEVARAWWLSEEKNIRPKWPYFLLPIRRLVKNVFRPLDNFLIDGRENCKRARASRLLGVDLDELVKIRSDVPYIDSFLFPQDWRTGAKPNYVAIDRITNLKNDWRARAFFEYAARDAIRLD
jgi:predicted nucleotidyltransferase